MSRPSLRAALHSTLAQIDMQLKVVEEHHAALLRLRADVQGQLNIPRATRQCACGAGISQERELRGLETCQRCETMTIARRANAVRPVCEAHQYSDQMSCGKCLLVWDTNDPEPPDCPTIAKFNRTKGNTNV